MQTACQLPAGAAHAGVRDSNARVKPLVRLRAGEPKPPEEEHKLPGAPVSGIFLSECSRSDNQGLEMTHSDSFILGLKSLLSFPREKRILSETTEFEGGPLPYRICVHNS